MSLKEMLLLCAISSFCTVSMAIATVLMAEQSGYYKNNDVLNSKQQQQLKRDGVQKLAENLRLEMQQFEEEEQQKQQHGHHIFEPFDFTNLRQFGEKQKQQMQQQQQFPKQHNYNDNNFDNYNGLDQQQHHQQQQEEQRQQLHPRRYKDNENSNIKNKNNNNEGNEYRSSYPYNNNNNNDDNNYKKVNNNNDNDGDDDDDDGDVVEYSNGNPNNGDWATPSSTHQDPSNDFRLQLSNRNEPFSNKNKSYNNNNSNNNIKNKENSSTTNTVNKHNDGHRNSRTSASYIHNNATHEYANNNNKSNNNNNIKNNNSKRENNGQNSGYNDGNSANSDTSNGHTIKTRDSQSYDRQLYAEDDFIDSVAHDYYESPDEELGMRLPYGIQNVRKRTGRQHAGSEVRRRITTYQSLCPTKRIDIPLETVGYEYRPNHYIEVTCAHNYSPVLNNDQNRNKICSEAGFLCIQLNRTIHLIRRNKAVTRNCWESEIRIVPSGCECMWPKHSNGDIIAYHDTQKRFNPTANIQSAADYTPGIGYQQLTRQIELVNIDGTRREENNHDIGYETYFVN